MGAGMKQIPHQSYKLRELKFDPIVVGAADTIPRSILDTARVDLLADVRGDLVMKLTAYVMGMKDEKKCFEWPETWWDGFKEAHFPVWAKKRWPPRYHSESVQVYKAVFPNYTANTQDWGRVVQLVMDDEA